MGALADGVDGFVAVQEAGVADGTGAEGNDGGFPGWGAWGGRGINGVYIYREDGGFLSGGRRIGN